MSGIPDSDQAPRQTLRIKTPQSDASEEPTDDTRGGSDTGLPTPGGRQQGCRLPTLPHPIAAGAIAIVPPRFGDGVIGGAEAVLADAAAGLAERGYPVEILTTCARDHFTWANEFRPGVTVLDNGVVVRRFPTEREPGSAVRDRIGNRILAGDEISTQDQQRWVNASLRCSGLWHHVFDYGDRYRALVFAPYMFWTTYAVSQIHSRRSIIMPCLHDEPPAGLDIFRSMIEGAGAVWFLTEPERDLAASLYRLPRRHAVVGASVDVPLFYDPDRFTERYGIAGPYLFYAGRREWGKGWEDLLAGFAAYTRQQRSRPPRSRPRPDLCLVTSGVGSVEVPPGLEGAVVDVGLISDQERSDAMAGAAAYVQPSAMESFSRTVLESMLAGTPVVANGRSAVVRWHLQRSDAGLIYRNEAELVECLRFVTDEPDAARAIARRGRHYVLDNYQLEGVLDRLEETLEQWTPLADPALVGGRGRRL